METKDQKTPKSEVPSNEISEIEKRAKERSDALDELQEDEFKSGNDSSNSGALNVNPPVPHDFPTFGIAKTDFMPSNHGRRTGRMIDHEPGE